MKTLCLLRHAKSSWQNAACSDFERPLNDRGKKDAPVMARCLRDLTFSPQLMVVSPAKRTRKTAGVFAEALDYPAERIIYNEEIYTTDLEGLVKILRALDDRVERAMLVGHNPFVTILAEWLSGEKFANIPTCGLVLLEFPVGSWGELDRAGGRLVAYEYPKK